MSVTTQQSNSAVPDFASGYNRAKMCHMAKCMVETGSLPFMTASRPAKLAIDECLLIVAMP